MRCLDCKYLRQLESFKSLGWCVAPAGRYHRSQLLKVDPYLDRKCKLFEVKVLK